MFYPKALVRVVSLLLCCAVLALALPVTSFGQYASAATMKVNDNVGHDVVVDAEEDKLPLFDPLMAPAFAQDSVAINYNTNPGTLSVSAATGGSGTITYQWQSSTNGNTWTNVTGATGLTYTPANLTATMYYKVIASDNTSSIASNVFKVKVYPVLTSGTITATAGSGASNTIRFINYNTAAANLINVTSPTGGDGNYTYAWQNSTDSVNWTIVPGYTSVSAITTELLTTKTYYRRVVTSNGVNSYSNTVTFNVYPQLIGGVFTGDSTSINYNTSPGTLTCGAATGGNGTITYQWQSCADNITWANITGQTTLSHAPGNLITSRYYRVVATSNGVSAAGGVFKVVVYPKLDGGLLRSARGTGTNYVRFVNYKTVVGVFVNNSNPSGGNGVYAYLWQSSVDSTNWVGLSNSDIAIYTSPDSLIAKTFYRRITYSNGDSAYSNVVTFYVYPVQSQDTFPSSGNAGIGTIAPAAPLHVFTMNNEAVRLDNGYIKYRDSLAALNRGVIGYGTVAFDTAKATTFGLQSKGEIMLAAAKDSGLFINSTGNVGIRTTTPNNFQLQVKGDIGPDADTTYSLGSADKRFRASVLTSYVDTVYGAGTASGRFLMYANKDTSDAVFSWKDTLIGTTINPMLTMFPLGSQASQILALRVAGVGDNVGKHIQQWVNHSNDAIVGAISSEGLFSITPAATTNILSDSIGATLINTIPATVNTIKLSPATKWSANGWNSQAGTSLNVNARGFVVPSSNLSSVSSYWKLEMRTGANAYVTGLAVTTAGDVGIGTTDTRNYKLAVNGDAVSTRVIVSANAWADHVFEPGYQLQSLHAVERFINKQKHLPGFPAAAKIVTTNTAAFQTTLLQKIEELTLYQVDQDKQIALLTNTTEAQEAFVQKQEALLSKQKALIQQLEHRIAYKIAMAVTLYFINTSALSCSK